MAIGFGHDLMRTYQGPVDDDKGKLPHLVDDDKGELPHPEHLVRRPRSWSLTCESHYTWCCDRRCIVRSLLKEMMVSTDKFLSWENNRRVTDVLAEFAFNSDALQFFSWIKR